MEGNTAASANPPPLAPEEYHKLGGKTLALFVCQRIAASLVLLIVGIVLFILQGESFLIQVPVPHFGYYVGLAAWACFVLFGIFFILSFLIAWLNYTTYRFALSENSLKIKRGIFNKEEIAIPYRQIQDVDITRDLGFQMVGLSRIVILTAGHEDEPPSAESGESEGILPALDKNLAEWLQGELLRRANIQKVTPIMPQGSATPGQ